MLFVLLLGFFRICKMKRKKGNCAPTQKMMEVQRKIETDKLGERNRE